MKKQSTESPNTPVEIKEWQQCGSVLAFCGILGPEVPEIPESHTGNEKRVWEYQIAYLVKIEQVLKSNLQNLLTVRPCVTLM